MLLAEALVLRSSLETRASNLQSRMRKNALYQEGNQPAEDPLEIAKNYEANVQEWQQLVARINYTNNQTKLEKYTITLTEALAKRDMLDKLFKFYNELAEEANPYLQYSRSEIRQIASVDVKEVRKQADIYAKERRELDLAIQQCNWQTDLL